jgi:polyvinyl alcohol dehydrogenase (cytochrome)
MRRNRLAMLLTVAAALAAPVTVTAGAGAAGAATFVNWPGYLLGPAHTSDNQAATAITPATVPALTQAWKWVPAKPTMTGQPGPGLYASPTVFNGQIYIGANTGVFYALNEATGQVVWQHFLGFVPKLTCHSRGITSTATVARDPQTRALTVYVAGGDGYLYALSAATGAVVWRSVIALPSSTVNDYYDWSSPTVAGGHIYVGVSSQCDKPLVAGGLKEFDQATGAQLGFYQTDPGAKKGPSIWSSASADPTGKFVYASTGNGGGDGASIVRLSGAGLTRLSAWQVPPSQQISDSDFGGSTTLFTASIGGTVTKLVGACNKNGVYYVLRRSNLAAGPVWQMQVGVGNSASPQCDAAGVWDGSHLFVSGNQTMIGGVTFNGSIRMVDPATGTPIWQDGLPGPVIGTPTLDGGGVLAVQAYAATGTLTLIDAATGTILRSIPTGPEFGQPVFADNMLLVPTQGKGLQAYR